MNTWIRMAMMMLVTAAAPACVAPTEPGDEGLEDMAAEGAEGAEGAEDVGEAEQALDCSWNYILHYNYTDSTGTYRWHVSQNLITGKWYVDERRIGGGFYKQYVLTPDWTVCPAAPESISLKYGTQTTTGPHNCLPNGNEEVHLEKQRLLVPQYPFATYECL